jgi:type IV secretory pathway VirD2 relaxase
MSEFDSEQFEVRVGRPRHASGSRRTVGFLKSLERSAKRGSRGGRSRLSSGRVGQHLTFHRRVVVKASIKKISGGGLAALRKHINYIQRDGTDERGEQATLYGSGVELNGEGGFDRSDTGAGSEFAERSKEDRHGFRFIISPEDSAKLQNLSAFTKDVVAKMESDLGTKLDWIAADHYDTGQPHTHLLVRGVRDNGKDLVIPRKYISRTLREQAQALVETELGPVSQMEGRVRTAKSVSKAGYTDLDSALSKQMKGSVIDLGGPVKPQRVWQRQLQVRRLKTLAGMGLAERLGSGRWKVEPDFADTLRKVSEQKEIVAAIYRTMSEKDPEFGANIASTVITERNMFDPNGNSSKIETGIVRHFGRPDDTRTGGFIVIETLENEMIYAKVGDDETFETLRKGQVLSFSPHQKGPRKIDHSIVEFADTHAGLYSEAKHATEGDRISPAYARSHVRRLEALRRKNFVSRNKDGSWRIPGDYLDRAAQYEAERTRRLPTEVKRDSRQTLRQMENARGVTWLDRRLVTDGIDEALSGNISNAVKRRQVILQKMGFEVGDDGKLPESVLPKLRAIDLRKAAEGLSKTIGKPYAEIGDSRSIQGIYRQSIERPSGKFAVIQRSKEFTLVPWRPVMEKRLGKSISGRISGGGISWDVTGRRGPSR